MAIQNNPERFKRVKKTAKIVGAAYLASKLIVGPIAVNMVAEKAGRFTGKASIEHYSKRAKIATANKQIVIPKEAQETINFRNKVSKFGEIYYYDGKKVRRFKIEILDAKKISYLLKEKEVKEINNIIENLKKRLTVKEKMSSADVDKYLSSLSLYDLHSIISASEKNALKNVVNNLPPEIIKYIDIKYKTVKHVTKASLFYIAILAVVELTIKTRKVIKKRRKN